MDKDDSKCESTRNNEDLRVPLDFLSNRGKSKNNMRR